MHRKAYVNASRVVLTMLLVAAAVLLGLAAAIAILGNPPEVGGWLRTLFGQVFSTVAIGLAAVLGIPAAIGLWAMAGANAPDAVPALGSTPRNAIVATAVAITAATAVVCLLSGTSLLVLNLALVALVGMAALGLAGAASFSTHRGRAILSAVGVVLVTVGSAWLLVNAFIQRG